MSRKYEVRWQPHSGGTVFVPFDNKAKLDRYIESVRKGFCESVHVGGTLRITRIETVVLDEIVLGKPESILSKMESKSCHS